MCYRFTKELNNKFLWKHVNDSPNSYNSFLALEMAGIAAVSLKKL